MKNLTKSRVALLLIGAFLLVASQMRFGLGVLAWIAPIPWLHYVRITNGWKSRLAFVVVAWASWVAVVLKIVTHPVPAVMALAFGSGIAVALIAPYLGANYQLTARRRALSPRLAGSARTRE